MTTTPKAAARIALVDDHELMRAGLRRLLEEVDGLEVVAEARDGREALTLARERRLDLMLLDVALPGLNGLDACARIRARTPEVRMLMVSMYPNDDYVVRALRAGASGYVLKSASAAELAAAIRAAMAGSVHVSAELDTPYLARYLAGEHDDAGGPLGRLTPRQREVLQLIAEGHGTIEIGRLMNLSAKTVATHRATLMRALGIRDVPGLVRFAIRSGLVAADAAAPVERSR